MSWKIMIAQLPKRKNERNQKAMGFDADKWTIYREITIFYGILNTIYNEPGPPNKWLHNIGQHLCSLSLKA